MGLMKMIEIGKKIGITPKLLGTLSRSLLRMNCIPATIGIIGTHVKRICRINIILIPHDQKSCIESFP